MGSSQVSTRVSGYYPVEPMCPDPYNRLDSMPVGLQNLGSTCWFNVVVQLLYHIPKFRSTVMEWQDPLGKCPDHLRDFIENLHILFVSIQFSEDKRLDPSHAVGTIGTLLGCGQGQQDASEYLALLLNRIRDAGMSIIEELFIGSLVDSHGVEDFLQYTLHLQCDTDLRTALSYSTSHSPQRTADGIPQEKMLKRRYFTKLPSIFLLDLSRLTLDHGTYIKSNYQLIFPSFLYMDYLLADEESQGHVSKPYQLHAAIIHHGQTNAGHFSIDLWDQQQQSWFHIDDNYSEVITWDNVIHDGYGGFRNESSAYCLVYVIATETKKILGAADEYDVNSLDVLNYLRDPADVRTSNSSYGLGLTLEAARSRTIRESPEADAKLFAALDFEKKRLSYLLEQSRDRPEEDNRLQHFVVYLMANSVDFEPFIYWALLIHFASFNMQLEEKTSDICTAARHKLAYLEKSTTTAEKNYFLQLNWCYNQFHLMARHLLSALEHISNKNFSAAVPIAVTILYLQHDLDEKAVKGPVVGFQSEIIHSVINRSIALLSDELLEANFESSAEETCMILFEAISVWIKFSDSDSQETVRSACQRLINRWQNHVIAHKNEPSAAEVDCKLHELQEIMNNPPCQKNRTAFKLHIKSPSTHDGPLLSYHWSRVWHSFNEQTSIPFFACS